MRKFGIDIDGVLADLGKEIEREAATRYDIHFNLNHLDGWSIEDGTDLTREQIFDIIWDDEVIKRVSPIPESVSSVNKLNEFFEVYLVTARSDIIMDATQEWLEQYNFRYNNLASIPGKEKAEYARKNNIRLFVEDKYETAIDLSEFCSVVFLFDYKYNQGEIPWNIYRVQGWEKLLSYLNI